MTQPAANGKHHPRWKLEVGPILTLAIIIVSMAVGWGVIRTRIDHLTVTVERLAETEEKLDERILRLREKQADLEAHIKSLEGHTHGTVGSNK